MDIFQATNAAITLHLAGADYRVRTLKYRELAEISAWLDHHAASPFDLAVRAIARTKADGAPLDEAAEGLLLDRAEGKMQAWPPRVATPEWYHAILAVPGGVAELVRAILSATTPGFGVAQAQALVDSLESHPDDLTALIAWGVAGRRPKDEDLPPRDHTAPSPGEWREAADLAIGQNPSRTSGVP